MTSKLLGSVQALLPDENIGYAIVGQKGLRPTWRFLSFWLIVANRPRIIALTDRDIVVMKAGQMRWQRATAKSVLFRVARTTLGPVRGSWTKLHVGDERIWVSSRAYPLIEKADAEMATLQPALASSPS
jgi:hypothetical protein